MFGSRMHRIAFQNDAVIATFGAEPAEVLKQIIASTGKPGGPFRIEASVSRAIGLDRNNSSPRPESRLRRRLPPIRRRTKFGFPSTAVHPCGYALQ